MALFSLSVLTRRFSRNQSPANPDKYRFGAGSGNRTRIGRLAGKPARRQACRYGAQVVVGAKCETTKSRWNPESVQEVSKRKKCSAGCGEQSIYKTLRNKELYLEPAIGFEPMTC